MRVSLRASALMTGAVALVASLVSCSQPPSALVLLISTDMAAPTEVDTMEIVAVRGGTEVFNNGYQLTSTTLPATLSFYDRDSKGIDEPNSYTIRLKKQGATTWAIERSAVLGFVDGKTKVLPLPLLRACVDVKCDPGSTCDQGKCIASNVDPETLPDFTTNEETIKGAAGAAGKASGGAAGQAGASAGAAGAAGKGVAGAGGQSGAGGKAGAGGGAGAGGQGGKAGAGGKASAGGDGGAGGAGAGGAAGSGGKAAVCGDGAVDAPEGCDDKNLLSGDGCSDKCEIEEGFTCMGAPSKCGDLDECLAKLDDCDANATCTDTKGGFTCACKKGYFGDGKTCTLIECVDGKIGFAPEGPSCKGLAPTCGANADESCCASPIVPGNAVGSACAGQLFYLDYDAAPDDYNTMAAPATVSNYALDRYEVTVGRFRRFVEAYNQWHGVDGHPLADEGTHPWVVNAPTGWDAAWSTGNCPGDTKPCLPIDDVDFRSTTRINTPTSPVQTTWTDDPAGNENRPINFVSWYEAFAFCLWDGGWLPTTSEWMYAAAGGEQQRSYPWSVPPESTVIDGTYASYTAGKTYTGCNLPSSQFQISCIIEVGTRPLAAGRWLHTEMAGNLSEWNNDWHNAVYTTPCDDCVQAVAGTVRAHRGSDLYDGAVLLRVPRHRPRDPFYRGTDFGFRCARRP